MNIDRHPFVLAALEDLSDGRTDTVTAADLTRQVETHATANGASTSPSAQGYSRHDKHQVTDTFVTLWKSLSTGSIPDRAMVLAVMRGVTKEPRHPAYRVTATDIPNVYQARVGDDIVLTYQASPEPTGDGSLRDSITWLAILHA